MSTVLFETVHGSTLYGLATPDSDRDLYRVVARRRPAGRPGRQGRATYARQTITGDDDVMTLDLSTWLAQCATGVPQSLEAMFATGPAVTVDRLPAFRAAYRAGSTVAPTYLRTIRSFARAGDFKRKRHALRLGLALQSILAVGRFDPHLSPTDAAWATWHAQHLDPDETVDLAVRTAWRVPA